MEENKKQFNLKKFIIIVMAGLLIFCLFKINDMSNTISNLESRIGNYQNEANNLRNEINSIYNNVDEQLKKEASLLSAVDYSLGEVDAATHNIPVTLEVIPKNITEDMQLSVRVSNETADFVRNGNEFTATIPVNMFIGYNQHPMLSIQTAEGIKTEYLESIDITYLYYQYLPTVYADIIPSHEYSNGKLKFDGDIRIECKPSSPASNVSVTKYELVAELNGKEIDRQNFTSEIKEDIYNGHFNKSYSANEGDEFILYLIAEDSLGYIHKSLTYYWLEKDGTSAESAAVDGSEYIYDKNGNLLNGN